MVIVAFSVGVIVVNLGNFDSLVTLQDLGIGATISEDPGLGSVVGAEIAETVVEPDGVMMASDDDLAYAETAELNALVVAENAEMAS